MAARDLGCDERDLDVDVWPLLVILRRFALGVVRDLVFAAGGSSAAAAAAAAASAVRLRVFIGMISMGEDEDGEESIATWFEVGDATTGKRFAIGGRGRRDASISRRTVCSVEE
jgi:hypothetical protein